MIRVPFLWKQLDGPQSNSIIDGIYSWFLSKFKVLLDYFWSFSIDKANSQHLTFIGLLMGIPRPLIRLFDPEDIRLRFTKENFAAHYGFSATEPDDPGGVFSKDYIGYAGSDTTELDAVRYRLLLQTFVKSEGTYGSILLLADLCYAFAGTNFELSWDAATGDVTIKLTRYNLVNYSILVAVSDIFKPTLITHIITGVK